MNMAALQNVMTPGAPGAHPAMGGQPQPPVHVGPVAAPSANQGNRVAAVSKIQTAVTALQEALPDLPLGSEVHNEVLTAVKKLSTALSKADITPDPHAQMQNLVQMARAATQRPAPPAFNAMMPPAMPAGGPPAGAMAA